MGKRRCFLRHTSWICSYNLTNHLLIPTWVAVGYWCPWPCLLWSVAHSTHTPDPSLHTHPFLHLYMPHTLHTHSYPTFTHTLTRITHLQVHTHWYHTTPWYPTRAPAPHTHMPTHHHSTLIPTHQPTHTPHTQYTLLEGRGHILSSCYRNFPTIFTHQRRKKPIWESK